MAFNFLARFLYLAVLPSVILTIDKKTTILITFDGFRWDFMSKTKTPNMDFIVKTGVKAPFIDPVFPTETLPNHYSMVTGLYPESHGILSGYYTYDPVWNSSFDMSNTESRWWDGGEPIWITNQKHGYSSGVCYFPGYDTRIKGQLPSFTSKDFNFGKPFINSKKKYMPFHQQVDTIIDWMSKESSPTFIASYFREPDETAHQFGPNSLNVIEQIQRCDKAVGYLLQRLNQSKFLETTNVIITSDHGHTSYNTTTFLDFDKFISPSEYLRHGLTTIQIWPNHNHTVLDVYKKFKRMENITKRISVYKIEDFPEKYHFKHSHRVPPIIAIMNEHWIGNNSGFWKIWTRKKKSLYKMRGDHVYRPELKSMKPFFIARGPDFKINHVSEPFETVDIYPMLCHLLSIPPLPNNGSLSRVQDIFRERSLTVGQRVSNFFDFIWQGFGPLF